MRRSAVLFFAAAVVMASSGTTADRAALAGANNRFAVTLFGRLAGAGGNLLFSPYSLTSALTLLDAGARGATATEIGTALHLPFSGAKLTTAAGALRNTLVSSSDYQLSSANALWPDARVKVRPEYLATAKRDFAARVEPLDFAQSSAAAATINGWVSDATHGRIPTLVAPSMLTPATRLVVTNAVWFKATWSEQFEPYSTRTDAFHLAGGATAEVPLMHQQARLPFAKRDGFRMLEMPYGSRGGMSMIVLLPDDMAALHHIEASLTAKALDAWIAQLQPTNVDVTFPRFHNETSMQLNEPLQTMGMKRAFGRQADFSGITANEPIAVDLIIQKARIDVTEEGTEAAAATGVITVTSAAPMPVQREIFRADHPFLYLIRQKETGTILFLGRLADPR